MNVAEIPMDRSQTATNNSQTAQVPVPHLDTHQLKLFQQLTQTVQISPPIQTPLLPQPPAPTTGPSDIVAGSSNSHTHWNNSSRNAPNKSWDAGQVGRIFSTPPSFEENDHHGNRGRFRGGGYRSRGRGRFGGDRDREGYRNRFHDDNARSPGAAQHVRRSRSRSPPRNRYGTAASRREVKPYSPPHRPSIADQTDLDLDLDRSSLHPGVDEFGREIRPSSDDGGSETPDDSKQQPPPPPPLATHLSPTSALAAEAAPVSGEHESSSTMSATSQSQAAEPTASGSDALPQGGEGPGGLASFDYSTFDPTLPASWEALGQAWAVTNGRPPSQEELMMFVMEVTVSMAGQQAPVTGGPAMQGNQRTGQGHWTGEHRGGPPRGGRGRGAFGTSRGGRGGFAYDGQAQWDYGDDGYSQGTDAVVLGEHTNAQDGSGWAQGSSGGGMGEEGDQQTGSQGAMGGRMQEVGDGNWVFTRNDGSS